MYPESSTPSLAVKLNGTMSPSCNSFNQGAKSATSTIAPSITS